MRASSSSRSRKSWAWSVARELARLARRRRGRSRAGPGRAVHGLSRRTSAVVATSSVEAEASGRSRPKRGARSARADVPPELLASTALRIGPAQPDVGQAVALAARPSRSRTAYRAVTSWPAPMAPASTVSSVKSRSDDGPVLVAELAVRGDRLGVELDLRPGVEGDRLEGPGQVLGEQPTGLVLAVDVGVEAVAVVGQLLEQGVVVVAHADPDRDELDARRRVLADARQDALGIGQADVGHAVGGEHDPVDAVLGERLAGQPVAQPQPGLEVGRAARVELVDGLGRWSARRPAAVGGRTTRASSPKVTMATVSSRSSPSTSRCRASLTVSSRASRSIEPEVSMTKVRAAWSRCAVAHVARPQADAQDDLVGIGERRRPAIDVDGEGVVIGRGVVVVEGVDPLLDPDAGRIGPVPVGDVALGDAVRRRVDVEGEGRHAVLVGVDVRVGARVVVGHPAVRGRDRLGRLPRVVGRSVVLRVGPPRPLPGLAGWSWCHHCRRRPRGRRPPGRDVECARHNLPAGSRRWGTPGRLGGAGAKRSPQVPERTPPVRRRATPPDAASWPAVPATARGRSVGVDARGAPGQPGPDLADDRHPGQALGPPSPALGPPGQPARLHPRGDGDRRRPRRRGRPGIEVRGRRRRAADVVEPVPVEVGRRTGRSARRGPRRGPSESASAYSSAASTARTSTSRSRRWGISK